MTVGTFIFPSADNHQRTPAQACRSPLSYYLRISHGHLKVLIVVFVLVNPLEGITIYLARTQSMTNAQRLAIPLLAGPGPIYLPLYHEAMLVSWAIGAFT